MRRRWRVVVAGVMAAASVPAAVEAVPTGGVQAPAPAAAQPDPEPSGALPGTVQGVDVVDEPGTLPAKVAATHDLTAAEAKSLLADPTVWVRPDGQVFFAEPVPDEEPAEIKVQGVAPYADTFELHSRPGAKRTIYLDFDGQVVSGSAWSSGGAPIDAVAFDIDGAPGFTVDELEVIQTVWAQVAEDFAPFGVDVTTQDPGVSAIRRDSAADDTYGTRVVITDTPASTVTSISSAGVAHFDSFDAIGATHDLLQPAWAFANGLFDDAKNIAEAVSHEVGHTLGLEHDGQGFDEYYGGHGLWAPIMGTAYDAPVSQWSKGEYSGASNTEDDYAVIASHGATALADDHANATASATTLTSLQAGMITPGGDKDLFKYVAGATGTWTFRAEPATTAPNLDIKLTLLSAAGTQLAAADPPAVKVDEGTASGLDASIAYAVTAGTTYYLRVEPTSVGTPTTGYSTYGTIGPYTLSASNQPTCASQDVGEPDDSAASARVATSGVASAARICRGDVDYVAMPARSGQPLSLLLDFAHAAGNLDLALIDPSGQVVSSATSTTDDETINTTAAKTGIYIAEVAGATPAVTNTYSLTMTTPLCPADDPYEDNDTLATARALQPATTYEAVACVGDADVFSVPVPTDTSYLIEVTTASRFGSLVVDDFGADGTVIDTVGEAFPEDEMTIYGYASGRSTVRFRVRTGSANPNFYTVRVIRAPGPPTAVTATAGYQYANVSWTAPAQDGGAPVLSYWVEVERDGSVVSSAFGAAPPLTVGGLTTGQEHTIRVYASNTVGSGPPSTAITLTPAASPTVPGIPESPTASVFGDAVNLSWGTPAADGGSPITGYTVTPYIGGVAQPVRQVGDVNNLELADLTPGVAYTFRIAARNAKGTGVASQPTDPIVAPASPPGPPTNVKAVAANSAAVLSWTAPADDGGAPLEGYEVTVRIGGVPEFTYAFSDLATTQYVGGLINGTTYTFTVAAVNEAGVGTPSAPSNAITPSSVTPPGPPGAVNVIAGNAQATVSWAAPASNGGSAITGYVVTPYVGATAQSPRTFNSTATSQVINGLTNGTAYTFKVAAKNAIGTGAQSDPSAPVTPQTPPSGARYVPLTPCRVFDTRATGAGGRLSGTRSIVVTGSTGFDTQGGKAGGCGVPAGAVAVEASISVVAPAAAGRLRVRRPSDPAPTYAFLEWTANQSITNTGLVNLATSGSPQLTLTNETGTTHVVVDVQGYFAPKATAPTSAAKYVAMVPCRIVDTRAAGGSFTNLTTRTYAVRGGGTAFAAQGGKSGGCAIPTAATAIEASVTAVGPTSAGYARAWPTGATPPAATFLNYETSRSLTNTSTFSLASSSNAKPLTLRNYVGRSHYVIDVQGYFVPQSSAPANAGTYVPLGGCDLVDTRVAGGVLAADATRSYVVKGTGAAFTAQGVGGGGCAIPSDAVALELTLIARAPAAAGYARLWPSGGATPTATFLNAQAGRNIANTGTVAIASSGSPQLALRNYVTATHYTVSAQGYFLPQA